MITLTWENLRDPEFINSLERLYRQPLPFQLIQKFVLIYKEVRAQQKLLEECHQKLLDSFGTPKKQDPKTPPMMGIQYDIPPEKVKEFNDEWLKLLETKFKIRVSKLDSKKLSEKIDLSPKEWILLEAIFLPFEDEQKASAPNQKTEGKEVSAVQ